MDPTGWFIHTLTRKSKTGRNNKGDPTFGSASTFTGRVEKKRALVRSASGEMVATSHVVVTQTVLSDEDIVWFPSIAGEPADNTASNNAARTPVSIEVATNKDGSAALVRAYF